MKTPWHRHDSPYFAFTLRGSSQKIYDHSAKPLECGPGTLLYHSSAHVHRDTFLAPEVRVLQIEIEPSRLGIFKRPLGMLPSSKDLARPAITCLLARLHGELWKMDELTPLIVEGLILELLAHLFRASIHPIERKFPSWLTLAEEVIRARFAEPLRLTAIAEEVGVHPVHLARGFRRYQGCTIGEMVRQLRIEYACREIVRSKRPLAEIALDAGFADQSHFSKTFRNHTGMSPTQFSRACGHANSCPAS